MSDIVELLEAETPEDPNIKDVNELKAWRANLYVRYILSFKKLEECYDQMVHPQKRIDLRKVLDSVMARILELKAELITYEGTDLLNIEDVLMDFKLMPTDIELPVPRFFVNERKKELEERSKLLDALASQYSSLGFEDAHPSSEVVITMDRKEALRILLLLERARQGRARAKLQKEIVEQQEREERAVLSEDLLQADVAATRIQRMVRGHHARKQVLELKQQELVFIGMSDPAEGEESQKLKALEEVQKVRRLVQEENQREYEQSLVTIRDKLKETEGPDMKEDMQDKIRAWFNEYRSQNGGKFPEYPDVEAGGSLKIFEPPPPPPAEGEGDEDAGGKGKKGGKDGKKGKKDGKKGKKDGKKGGKKGKKGGDDDDEPKGHVIEPSQHCTLMADGAGLYSTTWQSREEIENYAQKTDADLVKQLKRPEVETEVRMEVDEIMRVELENLKEAVERDAGGKKGKKGKKGGKKKGKKGKKDKKGKKGKKEKDLTADRTMESIFAELVNENILQKCPPAKIADFLGDANHLFGTMDKANVVADPSWSQIRHAAVESCIIPLGSGYVREKSKQPSTCLLFGPSGCGKTALARAIATETGANFLNLSPKNIAGKFPGKQSTMMLHMTFKVAKVMAPSVIYVDEIEQVFPGKKFTSKEDEPASRIKKDFLKELKSLGTDHRVMVIGCTSQPWQMEPKVATSTFAKHIFIPHPDYATRCTLWRNFILKDGGVIPPGFEVGVLAHISEGYTAGKIMATVKRVQTDRRMKKLKESPLTVGEYVNVLPKETPHFGEADEMMREFYKKLPHAKKERVPKVEGADEDDGKGKKGKKGGKKGKKK